MNPLVFSLSFPEELKPCIRSQNTTKEQLQSVLANPTVRQQFQVWAAQHPLFVSSSPLMQRIVKAIDDNDDLFMSDVRLDNRIAEVAKDHFCAKIEAENFNIIGTASENEIKQNIAFIHEYFDIGLLSADYIMQLLAMGFWEESCHESEFFAQALPLIKKLPLGHQSTLWSVDADGTGNTPLHSTKNFVSCFSLLKKLPLPEFLQKLSRSNKAGVPVLFNQTVFPMVVKYLIKEYPNSSKQIVDALAIFDQNGKTAFHYYNNFIAAFSTLKKIPLPILVKILALRDASGASVIDDTSIYRFVESHISTLIDGYKAIPKHALDPLLDSDFFAALKQMPLPLVMEMLHTSNGTGSNFLMFQENFIKFLDVFGHLGLYDFITLCAMPDLCGFSLVHNQEIFPLALSHIANHADCTFLDLLSFFSIKENTQGRTLLHSKNNFQVAFPRLTTLSFSQLIEILSIRDSLGTAIVHVPGIFPLLVPHIKTCFAQNIDSSKRIHQIVQIKDANRQVVLQNGQNFAAFTDLLAELTIEQIFELFSMHDADGEPLLHYPKIFSSLMPYILTCINKKACEVVQFVQFLYVRNRNGKIFFENNSKELMYILSIKDSSGCTILNNKEAFQLILSFIVDTLKYTPQQIRNVLLIPCDESKKIGSPLSYLENFKIFLPYLKTIPFNQHCQFFAITGKKGMPLMHLHDSFALALPFCIDELKYTPEQLHTALSLTYEDEEEDTVTPLYFENNFKIFLPYLKRLPIDQQVQFFSIDVIDGLELLHVTDIFEVAFPFLVHELKYTPEQVRILLSRTGSEGEDDDIVTPLYYDENFEVFFKYFATLSIDQQFDFLSLQSINNSKVIHEHYEKILQFITEDSRYTPEQLLRVLSIPDEDGKTPLHYEEIFQEFLPVLKTIPVDNHKDFFNIQGENQKKVLFKRFEELIEFVVSKLQYTRDQLVTTLSLKDQRGKPPLFHEKHFATFRQYLERQPFNDVLHILSIKDEEGYPCVYYPNIWGRAVDFLVGRPTEDVKKILALTTASGNTLPHYAHIRDSLMFLIQRHRVDLNEYVNTKSGLSAQDICCAKLSSSWLTRPKTAEFLRQEITRGDYDTRVAALRSRFEILWNEVQQSFDTGGISQNILFTNEKFYHPLDIKKCLLEMMALMEKQEAWTGTPPANEKERLHRFYCTQLFDFEVIIQELEKRKSPKDTAGHILDIAKVRFQGRCASAYQGELEQKRTALMGQVQGMDEILAQGAAVALKTHINAIIASNFNNDVHASNQLYFAAGFREQPDPLAPIRLEEAQRMLIDKFDPLSVYQNFEQQITEELASDYLALHTPDDFGPEYRALYESIKEDEEALLQELKACVIKCAPAAQREKLFSALVEANISFSIPSDLKNTDKETLLRQVFKGYSFVTLSRPVSHSLTAIKEHMSEDFESYKKSLPRDATYPVKLREAHNAKDRLFSEIDAVFKFLEIMEMCQVPLEKRCTLLKAKLVCQSHLDILGEDILLGQGITYSRAHGLPSRACAYARRLAWVQSFSSKQGKVLEYILIHMGVIEKREY